MSDMIGGMIFSHTPTKKGDCVRIIGKDEYKGYIGVVKNVQKKNDILFYSIELQADGRIIKRLETNIKKESGMTF